MGAAGSAADDNVGRPLIGRQSELEKIRHLLDGARAARSGALLLRSGPGMGKTALLEWAATVAGPDMHVATVTGVDGGKPRDYEGLARLLATFRASVVQLSGPQGRALRQAIELEEGGVDDLFLVGVGSLRAIADAAASRPVLISVDDAQWLDRASVAALGFVARRLLAENVAVLFAARDDDPATDLEGVAEWHLQALTTSESAELLDAAAPDMSHSLRRRVIAEAHGNPLALVTLPSEIAGSRRDTLHAAAPLPLPERLQNAFAARLRLFTAPARTLTLLAAVEPSGAASVIWRAAATLGVDSSSNGIDAVADLLKLGSQIEFRHPLMQAAAYHVASDNERRAAHRALAQAWKTEGNLERRAWHRAAAAHRTSESIAQELIAAANRLAGRATTVADLLGRAAELTTPGPLRGERRVAAARARLQARDPDGARATLAQALPELADDVALGKAHQISGEIFYGTGNPALAAQSLVKAARLLAPRDPVSARTVTAQAFEAAHETDQLAIDADISDVLALVRKLDPGRARGSYHDGLVRGFALIEAGDDSAGIAELREAVVAPAHTASLDSSAVQCFPIAWTAAAELYDDRAVEALSRRWLQAAHEQVSSGLIPVAVGRAPVADVHAGRFELAADGFQQASELGSATGELGPLSGYAVAQVWLMAWQGRAADVEARVAELSGHLSSLRRGLGVRMLGLAQTLVELGRGRHRMALEAGLRAYSRNSLFHLNTEPELVEAAVGSGRRDIAEPVSERLAQRAQRCGGSWSLGLSLRCQALLADTERAEELHRGSLEILKETILVPQVGRAHLLYGEWLRGQRRTRDARVQLETAYELFRSLGARGFAERAGRELSAVGGRPVGEVATSLPILTVRERQVSRLAIEGFSNDEIAERLFLSSSTVAYHLGKVFRKLEVSNRAQLHQALEFD